MIQVRRARSDDLAFILALEKHFAELGFVGSDSEQVHVQRLDSPGAAYFVVECDDQAVGFAILCSLDSINRSIELKRVVVSEPGRGIGRKAIRQVTRMAFTELSAHRLWLDVYSDNERARRTYRALGFVEEGTLRECIWHDNRFRSLVLMSTLEEEFRRIRGKEA